MQPGFKQDPRKTLVTWPSYLFGECQMVITIADVLLATLTHTLDAGPIPGPT